MSNLRLPHETFFGFLIATFVRATCVSPRDSLMALLDPYNPVPQVHQVSYALKEDEYGALVLAGAIDLQRLIWFKWPESVYCALYGLLEW